MARYEAHGRICDQCDAKKETRGDMIGGGNPFSGWFKLERTKFFHGIHVSTEEKWPKDICSVKCLKEFVESMKDE